MLNTGTSAEIVLELVASIEALSVALYGADLTNTVIQELCAQLVTATIVGPSVALSVEQQAVICPKRPCCCFHSVGYRRCQSLPVLLGRASRTYQCTKAFHPVILPYPHCFPVRALHTESRLSYHRTHENHLRLLLSRCLIHFPCPSQFLHLFRHAMRRRRS